MLNELYAEVGRGVPALLRDWDANVDEWCASYRAAFVVAELVQIKVTPAIFIFDQTHERVVVAYGLSQRPVHARDENRMRGFPDVNVGVAQVLSESAFDVDRGHFLSHASGGGLDINLFPHRRELNRGWSPDGARFRRMERWVSEHEGTFHFHRPTYDDLSWIPAALEYGVLRDGSEWWIETFPNK
jgi:hypothetical protein